MSHQCHCSVTCSRSIGPRTMLGFVCLCCIERCIVVFLHIIDASPQTLQSKESRRLLRPRNVYSNRMQYKTGWQSITLKQVRTWKATPSRNKTINGIFSWIHPGILFHVNNFFNCIASFSVLFSFFLLWDPVPVWINWSQWTQLSKQGETERQHKHISGGLPITSDWALCLFDGDGPNALLPTNKGS